MAEPDPFELVWMHKADEPSPYKTVQRFSVSTQEELGWTEVSKATAKKAGFVMPADADDAKPAARSTTAQEA